MVMWRKKSAQKRVPRDGLVRFQKACRLLGLAPVPAGKAFVRWIVFSHRSVTHYLVRSEQQQKKRIRDGQVPLTRDVKSYEEDPRLSVNVGRPWSDHHRPTNQRYLSLLWKLSLAVADAIILAVEMAPPLALLPFTRLNCADVARYWFAKRPS